MSIVPRVELVKHLIGERVCILSGVAYSFYEQRRTLDVIFCRCCPQKGF
jgi:hypothetical protein